MTIVVSNVVIRSVKMSNMLNVVIIFKVHRAPRKIFTMVNVKVLNQLRTVDRCLVHSRLRAPRRIVTVVVKQPIDFVSSFSVWHGLGNTALLKVQQQCNAALLPTRKVRAR